jgi:hypothetical protein
MRQRHPGGQVPLRHGVTHHRGDLAVLFVAACAGALLGCGSSGTPAGATETASPATVQTAASKPALAAAPVVVKFGTTFEVRVRFRRALPLKKDGTGAYAEFSIGPSTLDHAPVAMKRSEGFCYRETIYNDRDKESLNKLHAGSRATLEIVVHTKPTTRIRRRVTLAADQNAVPPGCMLSPKPGPG